MPKFLIVAGVLLMITSLVAPTYIREKTQQEIATEQNIDIALASEMPENQRNAFLEERAQAREPYVRPIGLEVPIAWVNAALGVIGLLIDWRSRSKQWHWYVLVGISVALMLVLSFSAGVVRPGLGALMAVFGALMGVGGVYLRDEAAAQAPAPDTERAA